MCEDLQKLRTELCRMPVKPPTAGTDRFELYTKEVMRRQFKLPSPNNADALTMSYTFVPTQTPAVVVPRPRPCYNGGNARSRYTTREMRTAPAELDMSAANLNVEHIQAALMKKGVVSVIKPYNGR
jgi:hypothetical protein